jgi:flagellar motor switch protein FliM
MSAAVAKEAKAVSLVRNSDDMQGFPGLVPIGERLSRGIRMVITGVFPAFPKITAEPIVRKNFSEWRANQPPFSGVCRFKIKPLKGTMLIVIPPQMVAQMVDAFYGGTGDIIFDRTNLSNAEICFLERISDMFIEVITAAWASNTELAPTLVGVETEMAQLEFVKDDDEIIIQPMAISGAPFGSVIVDCIYSAASLRSVKALSSVPEDDSAIAIDSVWRDRLREAILQVSLPVRTIFARTELPLTRLLCLQVGDMIPICLPNSIPVTVSGRTFANATVGESNGRASVRIEKLEQGIAAHD